jgi:hypothetical protein
LGVAILIYYLIRPVGQEYSRSRMTPDELATAARNLAHGLGIAVYIRDGRIYQHGPGIEFLPPNDARPTPQGAPFPPPRAFLH